MNNVTTKVNTTEDSFKLGEELTDFLSRSSSVLRHCELDDVGAVGSLPRNLRFEH